MTKRFTAEDARRFYDRIGARQDTQGFYENPALEKLIANADFGRARAVFELGCGTGAFARRLFESHLSAEARYAGIDVSPKMVSLARERLHFWADRAEIFLSDGAPKFPVPDRSFDRFVANYVFDLLEPGDAQRMLAEAHRILGAGGLLGGVSLAPGATPLSRFVCGAWSLVRRWRPALVGGCRPIDLAGWLEPGQWEVRYREKVVAFGVCSEVVVASRRS
jgi:ubiquinone/menaquinone biosynthesis C-methylase UbiE